MQVPAQDGRRWAPWGRVRFFWLWRQGFLRLRILAALAASRLAPAAELPDADLGLLIAFQHPVQSHKWLPLSHSAV